MAISQNKCSALLVLIFAVIYLSSGSIVFAADAMPTFTDDDFKDCKITGFEYDYSMQSKDENQSRAYVFPIMVTVWSSGSIFIKMQMKRKPVFKYTEDSYIRESELCERQCECTKILEADFI